MIPLLSGEMVGVLASKNGGESGADAAAGGETNKGGGGERKGRKRNSPQVEEKEEVGEVERFLITGHLHFGCDHSYYNAGVWCGLKFRIHTTRTDKVPVVHLINYYTVSPLGFITVGRD